MAIGVLEVQRVAVIGAGIMGTGIAQVATRAGYLVSLLDVAPGAAQKRHLDPPWVPAPRPMGSCCSTRLQASHRLVPSPWRDGH